MKTVEEILKSKNYVLLSGTKAEDAEVHYGQNTNIAYSVEGYFMALAELMANFVIATNATGIKERKSCLHDFVEVVEGAASAMLEAVDEAEPTA